jgi:hypothetical protein
MVHFLRQMQAFCQLEVIECSWQSLLDFTSKREGDLDALIQAHRTYLDRVVRKVLLLSNKKDKEVSSLHIVGKADSQEALLNVVQEALDAILQFRDATVRVPSSILPYVQGMITLTRRTTSTAGPSPTRPGSTASATPNAASTPPPPRTTLPARPSSYGPFASAYVCAPLSSKTGWCRSVSSRGGIRIWTCGSWVSGLRLMVIMR